MLTRLSLVITLLTLHAIASGCREKPKREPMSVPSQSEESASAPPANGAADAEAHGAQPVADDEQASAETESGDASSASPRSDGRTDQPAAQDGQPAAVSSRSTPKRFDTPQAAKQFARTQQRQADRLADSGQESQAYEALLQAWQGLREYSGDSSCDQLADEILQQLEVIGDALPSSGMPIPDQRLKIR